MINDRMLARDVINRMLSAGYLLTRFVNISLAHCNHTEVKIIVCLNNDRRWKVIIINQSLIRR